MTILVSLISRLPLSVRHLIGNFLGKAYSLIPGRERRIAELQMRICLGESFRPALLSEVFANMGRTIMESLNLNPILSEAESLIETENWHLAEETRNSGKATVVLTAHTGNWDLLAAYAIKRGYPLSTIGRKARSQTLQILLEKLRNAYGVKTIWREDPDSLKEIIGCLRNKGILAALIDQDTNVKSVHLPFFGMPAKYPVSLISMAQKNQADILTAFIFRTSARRFKIILNRIDSSASPTDILLEYSNLLERYIRQYPGQWVWFHKRWRSLENGKVLSSADYISYLENCESTNVRHT